jgi:hypothetical protein
MQHSCSAFSSALVSAAPYKTDTSGRNRMMNLGFEMPSPELRWPLAPREAKAYQTRRTPSQTQAPEWPKFLRHLCSRNTSPIINSPRSSSAGPLWFDDGCPRAVPGNLAEQLPQPEKPEHTDGMRERGHRRNQPCTHEVSGPSGQRYKPRQVLTCGEPRTPTTLRRSPARRRTPLPDSPVRHRTACRCSGDSMRLLSELRVPDGH